MADKNARLDEGVEETFPASDPVAETQPHTHQEKMDLSATKRPNPRSPDWMFAKP